MGHSMTPLERYERDIAAGHLRRDRAQGRAVERIQALYDALVADWESASALLKRARKVLRKRAREPVRGLYLWGGVGRGKTMLVDAFFDCLPFPEKRRIHFHRFMHKIHHELKHLKEVEDPLQRVADRFAEEARVICFDEFYVGDITDAMLLGNLLRALFERGVTLVATSNTVPDRLYWGGLQRERFLPAIALIKEHTEVMHLDGHTDHRLRFLDKAEIYHCPLDAAAERCLRSSFQHLAPDAGSAGGELEIDDRAIPTVCQADGVAWFEFEAICGGPRAPSDYIEIARSFQAVLIGNIPQLNEEDNGKAKRLIHLVDELYDRRVKLIVSAAVTPDQLYRGTRLAQEFQRTVSRLEEMRTHAYLAKRHLP
jgi:cell division protein ZapE